MSQSNFNKKIERMKAIRMGSPVSICGLTFYPITMSDYEIFKACSAAWTLRMSTLPVKYISRNFLDAIFCLDIDLINEGNEAMGLFSRVMRMLFLSLREPYNIKDLRELLELTIDEKKGICIEKIKVTQNGNEIEIKPNDFVTKIRPLIAEMNGLKLPNERENPDLVRDLELKKQFNAMQSGKRLNENIDDLIASVAYNSHIREKDILEWTVKEFEGRVNAIERDKNYTMYGQAQLSGMVSFKNGNPFKSWCYDVLDDSLGTQSLADTTINGLKIKN